jgi:phosphomannomutase / phosphoglucomutase
MANNNQIDKYVFRGNDIRGIAMGENPQLTPEFANLLGKALGTYFLEKNCKHFLLGRDGRHTSEDLHEALSQGVMSTGLAVTSIGLTPSPMHYYSLCKGDFDCGAVITASHNPKQYNGFKIVIGNAHSVYGEELQKIYELMLKQDFVQADFPGAYQEISVIDDYVTKLHSFLNLKRPLKVIIDTGNGVGGPFMDAIFKHPMLDVEVLFQDLDPNFPNHPANPEKAENMLDLSKAVVERKADIGLGFDADADRLGMVDEHGKFHGCDLLLMLLAEDFLSRNPGETIIFDPKISKVVENRIAELGGKPYRFKTGHSFIEAEMEAKNIKFGGELSGHYFFHEDYYGFDDAMVAAMRLLSIVSRAEFPVSQFFANLPKVFVTPEVRIPCADAIKFQVIDSVIERLKAQNLKISTLDGVFVEFNSTTWAVCRCSNTAPQLTFRFESQSPDDLKKVINLILDALGDYQGLDLTKVRDLLTQDF